MGTKRDATIDAVLETQKAVFLALLDTSATDWLQLNLTMAQVKALFALRQGGAMTVGGLAEMLKIGLPAASVLADKLVQMDWVERYEDPNDRRRTFVKLTSQGEQLMARLRQGRRERLRDWLARMEEGDLDALERGMHALARAALGEHAEVKR